MPNSDEPSQYIVLVHIPGEEVELDHVFVVSANSFAEATEVIKDRLAEDYRDGLRCEARLLCSEAVIYG